MNNLILDGRTKEYFTGDTLKEFIIKNDESPNHVLEMKDGNSFSPYVSIGTSQWVVGLIGQHFYCDTRNSLSKTRMSDLYLDITVSKNRVYTFDIGTFKSLFCTKPVKNKILKFLLKEKRLEELYKNDYKVDPVENVITENSIENESLKLLSIEKIYKINSGEQYEYKLFRLPKNLLIESDRKIDEYFDYKFNNYYEIKPDDYVRAEYRYEYDVISPFINEEKKIIYKKGQEEQAIELLKNEVLC